MAAPRVHVHKHVVALPAVLEANAVYHVRRGSGFDLYVTNASGVIVAYPLNVVQMFGAAGSIPNGRIFTSIVTTAANGTWSCDLTPGGFSGPPNVQAQAIGSSSLLTGAGMATCMQPTATLVTGTVVAPLVGGLIGLVGAGVKVHVSAIGT